MKMHLNKFFCLIALLSIEQNTIAFTLNDMISDTIRIEVITPANQSLTVYIVRQDFNKYLIVNNDSVIKSESQFGGKKVSFLKSGRVFFHQFSGRRSGGVLFETNEDYYVCFDESKYYEFYITKYKKNYYYEFTLNSSMVNELKLSKRFTILNDRKSNKGTSLKFEDDTYLFLLKPDEDYGYWFPSSEAFVGFYEMYHGIGDVNYEPEIEAEVSKLFMYSKDVFLPLKRLRSSLFSELRDSIQKEEDILVNFNSETHKYKFFSLVDKKYMLHYDSDILLLFDNWDTASKFLEVLKSGKKNYKQGFDFSKFTSTVNEAKTVLHNFLKIELEHLDYSAKSLDIIDKELNKIFITSQFIEFIRPYLVQYYGEVIKHEVGGEWDFKKKGDEWYPFVRIEGQKDYNFCLDIDRQLTGQEYTYKSCIYCMYLAFEISLDK